MSLIRNKPVRGVVPGHMCKIMMGAKRPSNEVLYTESLRDVKSGLLLSMHGVKPAKAEPIMRCAIKDLQRETTVKLLFSDVFLNGKEILIHIIPEQELPDHVLVRLGQVIQGIAHKIGFGNLDIQAVEAS